jgi:hypothetical protein
VVEEVLELLDDLFGVLDLVLELDRRLGDDLVGGVDRRAGADRQRERVTGARIDLELAAVHAEADRGIEGVLAQLGHRDAGALDVELAQDVREQIVGHRTGRGRTLELHQNRRCLRMPDPDRQELVVLDGLQQNDRLLPDHVEANPVDDHLLHVQLLDRRVWQV